MATDAAGIAQREPVTGRSDSNEAPDPFAKIKSYVLRELAETERLLLILWYAERMTPAEISAVLGVPEQRVTQIHDEVVGRMSKAA